MSKVVKLSSVMEREEKLKEIYEGLEEIKDQLTALIDERNHIQERQRN